MGLGKNCFTIGSSFTQSDRKFSALAMGVSLAGYPGRLMPTAAGGRSSEGTGGGEGVAAGTGTAGVGSGTEVGRLFERATGGGEGVAAGTGTAGVGSGTEVGRLFEGAAGGGEGVAAGKKGVAPPPIGDTTTSSQTEIS